MIFIIPVSGLLLLMYLFIFYRYFRVWRKSQNFPPGPLPEFLPFLSVVIPLRNEEKNLNNLIKSLLKQDYEPGKIEYIFIDDHSTDMTYELLSSMVSVLHRATLIRLTGDRAGKKQALAAGVELAKGELVVTTDGDCVHPRGWLMLMARFYISHRPVLISGPVRISPTQNFFTRLQALEFTSLAATGWASVLRGSPVMCNAANLAFEKSIFIEAFEHIHPGIPSGDDIFLMLYVKRKYPGRTMFLKHPEAIVDTRPVSSLPQFMEQRVRWASKSGRYRDGELIFLSLLVFLFNVWLVFLIFLSLNGTDILFVLLPVWIAKSVGDYVFLKTICRFNGQEGLMKFFLPSQLIYPFYIVAAAVGGIFKAIKYRNIEG